MCRSMYFFLGLLVHAPVALANRNEKAASCALQSEPAPAPTAPETPGAAALAALDARSGGGDQIFVHLADPQLGMLNQMGTKDFSAEASMAGDLAQIAAKIDPPPTFFFLGGDMQNAWPDKPDPSGEGLKQREAVQTLLSPIENKNIPIVCTPGNHDVADEPRTQDLINYNKWWNGTCGTHQFFKDNGYEKDPTGSAEMWKMDNVLYFQLDSQLYFTSKQDVQATQESQTKWVKEAVISNSGGIKRIMVLTHIPPFMNEPGEAHGWANWRERGLLDVFSGLNIPVVWVCGHFHTNVINDNHQIHKIRVTSAAGTTMFWGDSNGDMEPEDAAAVASIPINQAFCEKITMLSFSEGRCSGFSAEEKGKRMQPIADRSGMRIFRVKADGSSMADKWFTLTQLKEKLAANEEHEAKRGKLSLEDLGFVGW